MPDYQYIPLDAVSNPCFRFLKLSIDGKCPFDEFEKALRQKEDIASLKAIYALMDNFSRHIRLPFTKFRHIVPGKNEPADIYEFKKNALRVYVRLIEPDVVVVTGGYKKNQDNDVAKVKRIVKDL